MGLPNEVISGLLSSAKDEDTYQVSRSLRFNSADSAYLSRTSVTSDRQKFTWSFWTKITSSANMDVISAKLTGASYPNMSIIIETNVMRVWDYTGSAFNINLYTTQVFRDYSSWYHVVLAVDTTQATAANRVRLYINGSEITSFSTSTYPAQNTSLTWGTGSLTNVIGAQAAGGSAYANCYMAEWYLIDGQQLTPSSFGQTDINGRWVPKAYTGTYGAQGAYLKFADNSGTTATTLGKDSSPNGNNWTPNNFSVTAGVGNDSLVDSPTNYGTDTGLGGEVRGNYATFNNAATPTLNTISDGGLKSTASAAAWYSNPLTMSLNSGKWYCEFHVTGGTYERHFIGISLENLTTLNFYGYGYGDSNEKMRRHVGSTVGVSLGTNLTPIPDFENNDIVGLCVDADNGKLWIKVNNSYIEGDAVAGTGANVTWTAGSTVTPTVYMYSGDSIYLNSGQRPFAYTAPTGFKALCTTNLPTPTIKKSSQYMNIATYTGTGATRSITGVGFQPDLVWTKSRSNAETHKLVDSVRGATKALSSETTGDEVTESGLTSFDSDGFTINGTTDTGYNTNTYTYVGWAWKKGVTPGFDIVTYTGNGSARTISHSLGAVPHFMIVKARTTAGTDQGWPVYHRNNTSAPETDYLLLNSTNATADLDTIWNDTAPTSSVFSVGTNALVNTNNDTYVAYLWTEIAGFSRFGTYTGNNSTDGPFVWCGFRPAYVMIKSSSAASTSWFVSDSKRKTFNVVNLFARSDLNNAEYGPSVLFVDFLSNGFKIRNSTYAETNSSGSTYIFAAFAETPFKYSRGR